MFLTCDMTCIVFDGQDYETWLAECKDLLRVIKWKRVVYHFYTAVGNRGWVIVLAASVDMKIDNP